MKYLLDTHILIWTLFSDDKLPTNAKSIINNPKNDLYYSAASVWEVVIKHNKMPSKMPVTGEDLVKFCHRAGIMSLPITSEHTIGVGNLSRTPNTPPHNDPFDKLLISQAKIEKFTLITHDKLLAGYNEKYVLTV